MLRDNLVQSSKSVPQGSPEQSNAYNTCEGNFPASSTFNVPTVQAHSRPQWLLPESVLNSRVSMACGRRLRQQGNKAVCGKLGNEAIFAGVN